MTDEWVEVVGGEDHIDLRAGARGRAEAGGGGDIGTGDVRADQLMAWMAWERRARRHFAIHIFQN